MSLTEEELISQLNQPSKKSAAFSIVFKTYQERLYWHIRKMVLIHDDANDILQNTFLKAWNGLEGFRGEAKLSTWLYKIATNETLTFLANKKLKNNHSIYDIEDIMIQNLKADTYFNGNDAQLKLQKAILTLPEKQRLVFNMKYFEDITYEQLEDILETSVGALKASYHHAVKKIEKYFEDKD